MDEAIIEERLVGENVVVYVKSRRQEELIEVPGIIAEAGIGDTPVGIRFKELSSGAGFAN